MDHLEIEAAHVVGSSMGGMVAQTVAIRHTHRVRSLTSIMSTTGDLSHFLGKPKVLRQLTRKPPMDREGAIEHLVTTFRTIHGKGHLDFDEDNMREVATLFYERGFHPPGLARQLGAIAASGSRRKELEKLRVPTQVIHGSHDPLLRSRAGRATARAIPGARLDIIEGMGHGMPRETWPRIVGHVRALADESRQSA
jgi:pimeloyl-ACP methyl ester carboxylesterase